MLHRFYHWVIICVCVFVLCDSTKTLGTQQGSREVSALNERTVLDQLRLVSESFDKGVRLYYLADCQPVTDANIDSPVPFPHIDVQPPSQGASGVVAIREIFQNDRNVSITEDESAVRIWIGKVPTSLLQTKLPRFILPPMARYNHTVAVETLKNAKETKAAARFLGLGLVSGTGGLVAQPQQGLPHLPAIMQNVKLDQVLDMIAKTFHDPVVYGACEQPTGTEHKKSVWID